MTESCVQEIKLPNPKLKSFIREVESKYGEILSLSELYARDQKLGNEIILGVVDTVFPVIKKRDRQLQVICLFEVTIECHRGQLFRVCAFNQFATSLADASLHEGDFVAFCSPCIWESSQYHIEKGCHHLEAHIGFPEQPSAKIFFARKPHITNAGTAKQKGSSKICKSLGVSLEHRETPNTGRSNTPPSPTETSHNAAIMSPIPPILSSTARTSPVPPILSSTARTSPVPPILSHTSPSILPCTSSSRDNQIQRALDDSAVALRRTRNKYTYKKISELVEPEKKVNIYGVIHTIVKMPKEDSKHAVVRLIDETCGPGEEFRVHIFFSRETAFPKLEHGYILRLHRLKTELFDGVLDGRVFHATDVVTFPPVGRGIADAFATSKCFNFTDSDAQCLTELRRWIASQKQQQHPLPAVPVTSNTTLVRPVLRSEPHRTVLSEIKKEGNYVLLCKVLDVDILSDEIRFITVTDGTLFVYCIHLNEDERHATHEVRIMVLHPSPLLKEIRRASLVELTNVTVQLLVAPTSSLCNWPYLTLKMDGNNCSVKIFRGFESEAIILKRQLQVAHLRDQQRPTDSLDHLITERISGSPHQSNSDNTVQVADTVTHSSVERDCQQSEMTAHLFNYNSYPVQQYVVSSGGETSLQSEDERCSPSLISQPEEELNCQPLQKSSVEQGVTNVQQICLREQCVLSGSVEQKGDNREREQCVLSGSVEQKGDNREREQCVLSGSVEQKGDNREREQCVLSGSVEQKGDNREREQCVLSGSVEQKGDNREREQCVLSGSVEQKGDNRDGALLLRKNMQQDFLAGNTVNVNRVQEMAEEMDETYTEFADGVATGSDAWNCTSAHSIGDQNTTAEMNEVESLASEIIPASEVDGLDSSDNFSALTQAHLRDTGISNYPEAGTSDVDSDAETVIINSPESVSRRVQRSCEDGGSPDGTVACADEDEDMECHSAELHSSSTGCKQKFASGIISGVQGIPADISHVKRTRLQNGELKVYLLKAWVKDIEPPITRGSEMNIVSGFCDYCNSTQSYEALKMRHKNYLLCQYCFQKGQKIPVALEYLLRLHLVDENDDELTVTVAGNHGVELLGCTVSAYLYDSLANRRVLKILTDLIAKSNNVLLQDRGPMLKLMVTPVHTAMGTEFIVHSTYLYATHNSEEQRN